jgi:hypothetical protein
MHNLNPDLLFQRMTRGALRGPAAEEITTMSRCKGKLDTGERCAIVAAPGKDRCTGCEARGAALYDKTVKAPLLRAHDLKPAKRGRPAKKGAVSEAQAELQAAAAPLKTVTSDNKLPETTAPVRRLTDGAQLERDDFEAKYGKGNCSCHISPPCSSCLHPGNPVNQEEDDSCWTTDPETTLCDSCAGNETCGGSGWHQECAAYSPAGSANENTADAYSGKEPETKISADSAAAIDKATTDMLLLGTGAVLVSETGEVSHIPVSELRLDADLAQVPADSSVPGWVRDDAMAQAMLGMIGCSVSLELLAAQPDDQIIAAMDYAGICHLQASDNDDVEIPPMPFFLKGTQAHEPEPQIKPVAATPPQEQVTAWLGLSSPLAALVVTPEPSEPPLPDTAIVLDLGPMFETLVDRGVGTVTILELLDALFISKTYGLIRQGGVDV